MARCIMPSLMLSCAAGHAVALGGTSCNVAILVAMSEWEFDNSGEAGLQTRFRCLRISAAQAGWLQR